MSSIQSNDSDDPDSGSPYPSIFETHPGVKAICASLYAVTNKGYPQLQKNIDKIRRRFDDAEPALNALAADPEVQEHPATKFILSHLSKLYRHCYPEFGLARLFSKPWHRYNPPDPSFNQPTLPAGDTMLRALLEALVNPKPIIPSPQSAKPTGFRVRTFDELQALRFPRPRAKVEPKNSRCKRDNSGNVAEEPHELHLFLPSDDGIDAMAPFKAHPSRLLIPFNQRSDDSDESDDQSGHAEVSQVRVGTTPSRIRGIGQRISEYSGSDEDECGGPEENFYKYEESYVKFFNLQCLISEQAVEVEALRMTFLRAVTQAVKRHGITAVVPSIFSSEVELWALCDQNPHDRPVCRGRLVKVRALG